MFTRITGSIRYSTQGTPSAMLTRSTGSLSPGSSSNPYAQSSEGGVESRLLTNDDVQNLETLEMELDNIVGRFLASYEKQKGDQSGIMMFDTLSTILELEKLVQKALRLIPELDSEEMKPEVYKLSQVQELVKNDKSTGDVLEPSLAIVTNIHSLFHEKTFQLLGSHSCPLQPPETPGEVLEEDNCTVNSAGGGDPSALNTGLPTSYSSRSFDQLDSCVLAESKLLNYGEKGVLKAFDLLEMFSRYFRDLTSYIDRKLSLDMDYCQRLFKISSQYAMPTAATNEGYLHLPLWSSFSFMNMQDKEYCRKSQETIMELQGRKFMESLRERKQEFEDMKKEIRITWEYEEKTYHDALIVLKKSKETYWARQNEANKLKDIVSNISSNVDGSQTDQTKYDRRKRQQHDDAEGRAQVADKLYRQAIKDAKNAHVKIQDERKKILNYIKTLIVQAEKKIQSASVNYFKNTSSMYQPRGIQYRVFLDQSRSYMPGHFYREQLIYMISNDVELLSITPVPPAEEQIVYEPYQLRQTAEHKSGRLLGTIASLSRFTESDVSQTFSTRRSQVLPDFNGQYYTSDLSISESAKTHNFQSLNSSREVIPSMCIECETYIFYEGLACKTCRVLVHMSCLESLTRVCPRVPENPATRLKYFRVPLAEQPRTNGLPILLQLTVEKLEVDFLDIQGIYRTEGAKIKVQKLCQSFEENGAETCLDDQTPQVICTMLKHYMRVLPNSLLCADFYDEWLTLGREWEKRELSSETALGEQAIILLDKLPALNFVAIEFYMGHLRKVADHAESNKMSASNIGKVLGPTLLWKARNDATVSASEALEVNYLACVVELLIDMYGQVFAKRSSSPLDNIPAIDDEDPPPNSRVLKTAISVDGSKSSENSSGTSLYASAPVIRSAPPTTPMGRGRVHSYDQRFSLDHHSKAS